MEIAEDIKVLTEEYRDLLKGEKSASQDLSNHKSSKIEDVLIGDCNWSPIATEHLLHLANDYGSFMLKNALALSLVLGIEDGKLGF
jgi:hypothetical protein